MQQHTLTSSSRTYLYYEPVYELPGCIEYSRGNEEPPEPCTVIVIGAMSDWIQHPNVSNGCWWREMAPSKQG